MISIPRSASDLNGAYTSAAKITRHRQTGQAAVTGQMPISLGGSSNSWPIEAAIGGPTSLICVGGGGVRDRPIKSAPFPLTAVEANELFRLDPYSKRRWRMQGPSGGGSNVIRFPGVDRREQTDIECGHAG